jgi:hypothetical protein
LLKSTIFDSKWQTTSSRYVRHWVFTSRTLIASFYAFSFSQAQALKDEGNKEFTSGNYERAAELFGKAIELDPQNHVLYSNRAGAYTSLKRFSEALADAEKTVELNPSWPKVCKLCDSVVVRVDSPPVVFRVIRERAPLCGA